MIKKYVPDEVILDDQQHQEMCQIHSSIEESAADELELIYSQVNSMGQMLDLYFVNVGKW